MYKYVERKEKKVGDFLPYAVKGYRHPTYSEQGTSLSSSIG